jgi:chromosome partitioning protein
MSKIISIASSKGGVAKSTSTVELATVLTNMGHRVLVIDLDENCSLGKNVGAELGTAKTIYEVLHGKVNVFEAIQKNALFDIITGSKSLSLVASEFIDRDDVYLLADLMEILQDDYDFIFIDNAPSRSLLLTMTYIAADYIIIPTVCDDSSTDMIIETERDIDALVNNRHHDSHAKVIGYLLTRYQKTNMHGIAFEKLEEIAAEKENPPFVMSISEAIKASEVKSFRTAISSTAKSSKLGREYYAVANEILKRIGEDK